ncbi:M48 family metallopeptidase [Fusobacterium massiliense]|uniref:M48 family metallopeptidase n=1 Tax=Fusobacterium massiliense TaxID=1852365 RepID=UPI00093F8240|nr:SprT family zinc-dependent metalloprotease [Fusobacterium massiliense]
MKYLVKRKKIKNFILRIYPNLEVVVSVPLRTSDIDIEKFVDSKKEWIEKTISKIKKIQEIKNENNSKEKIKFLGKILNLKIIDSELFRIKKTEKILFLYTSNKDFVEIEKVINEWKKDELKNLLEEYIKKYSILLGKNIDYFMIKKMTSAWGIYHRRGNYITFNSELIEKNIECIEYVVLHELCHIFHMNHQKEFWALVQSFMPDYKKIRELLKQSI